MDNMNMDWGMKNTSLAFGNRFQKLPFPMNTYFQALICIIRLNKA